MEREHEVLVQQMTLEVEKGPLLGPRGPLGCDLPLWQPGAHIDLILPTGRGGSKSIYEVLRPGTTKFIMLRNNFALVAADHHLFTAGGIDIIPLLPMMAAVAAHTSAWHLLYCGRLQASMALLEDRFSYGPNVAVAPEDEVVVLDFNAVLTAAPSDASIYHCGPEPMIIAAERACERSGQSAPCVERFAAMPAQSAELLCEENAEFDVVLMRKGITVSGPSDMSILETLEGTGYGAPCWCWEGCCGCRETAVIEGIVDHRDGCLSQLDRGGGKKIIICVSRSRSPRLALDL